ncbi:MAG TPA: 2-oxoglutarate dehydrogenase complex dihydrolipoyllysine-residue succinyltransferase [Opitutaceae bacterium]|nr:2-oxoglutarate dehydrogenase complex dihydrolipoyllysine-residue succinyltransferase [Opitutaceae bacterium]
MSIEVKIPPMGESISSGVLAKWHVASGDAVKKDQVLFELETDKITSEGVAESDGTIQLAVEAGAEVKIGQVVATIDESKSTKPVEKPDSKSEEKKESAPAKEGGEDKEPPAAKSDEPDTPKEQEAASEVKPKSPAVRRIAEETGIDPDSVTGSGKGGRVTKGDMLETAQRTPELARPNSASSKEEPSPSGERTSRRRMTPLRARIAERLVQAKNQTAMLTTFNEVDMTAIRDLRARYQEAFTKKHGVKLGFMSFFVKAAVHALKEVPAFNARIDGDSIIENHFYDIGVAVSTDRGLMVPVLRDCDTKSMAEIEKDLGTYATKAREGKIKLEDLDGGVFTVTNGGIFGSLLSTPILNQPQCGILGMHSIQDRPVARDGQVVIRPMMYLAMSYDHRIVDGKEAVTFLIAVKQVIEDPARLVLNI